MCEREDGMGSYFVGDGCCVCACFQHTKDKCFPLSFRTPKSWNWHTVTWRMLAYWRHIHLRKLTNVACWTGREVKPGKIGIVGKRGPGDQQAFMVGFFKMSSELHVRRTRSTRQRQLDDVTYSDDPYSSYGRNGTYPLCVWSMGAMALSLCVSVPEMVLSLNVSNPWVK